MRYLMIMNPGSRAGRGRRRWQRWEDCLRGAGVDLDCVRTDGAGHARALAFGAENYDTLIAAGGDGTINEVLDGIVSAARPGQAMGVLYSGTSPDFCRFHDIPVEPDAAMQTLLRAETRQVDVARIGFHNQAGEPLEAYFGCGCNIGMGATVARRANRLRRLLGDRAGTALAVLLAVGRNARVDLDVCVDGEAVALHNANNLSVVINPYLASGLRLDLDIDPRAGELWLLGVSNKSRAGLLALFPRFYDGTVVNRNRVFLRRAQSVTISSTRLQEIEFDGDPRGFLPASVNIATRALKLVASHERT